MAIQGFHHCLDAEVDGSSLQHDARQRPFPRGTFRLRLPATVRPREAAAHAVQLLGWLAHLRREDRAGFDWLVDKWLYASDALEGSIRLDDEDEVARARALCANSDIELEVRAGYLAQRRCGAVAFERRYRERRVHDATEDDGAPLLPVTSA